MSCCRITNSSGPDVNTVHDRELKRWEVSNDMVFISELQKLVQFLFILTMSVIELRDTGCERERNTVTEQGNTAVTMVPLTRARCGEKLG
jgi:hypothetical protein